MPTESFIDKRFNWGSRSLIDKANAIITEYESQGFTLTLRQLYYQFVARGFLKNTFREYKNLGAILNDARLAGLVDWNAIEDITRFLRCIEFWRDAKDAVSSRANQYAENLWKAQEYRPEVWVEKDALLGVVAPACDRLRVPYYACRGYSSQSEQWRAGKRFQSYLADGFTPIVFHLGDHDPSGIDMTRDNFERLSLFSGDSITVKRLALNADQIKKYNPPPNPTKMKDSRAAGYVAEHGDSSWELDALEPKVIDALITKAVSKLIDEKKWKAAKAKEDKQAEILVRAADRWEEVVKFLHKRKRRARNKRRK